MHRSNLGLRFKNMTAQLQLFQQKEAFMQNSITMELANFLQKNQRHQCQF
jgi:hypothetical protein